MRSVFHIAPIFSSSPPLGVLGAILGVLGGSLMPNPYGYKTTKDTKGKHQGHKGWNAGSSRSKGAILSIGLLLMVPLFSRSQDLPSDSTIAEAEGPLLEHLKSAAKEDPGLIAAFKDYHSALQKVPQVGTLPDPELALGYFISPVETRVGPQRANFSLSQMFPWFGTLDKKKEAAALKAKAEYAQFRAKRAKLYQKVRNTWYELYYKKAHIRSVDSTLRTLRTMEEISEARYRTGQRSMADHLRIRMERREMEETLRKLKDDLRPLKTRFNSLIGRDPASELEVPTHLDSVGLPWKKRATLKDSIIAKDPKLDELEHKLAAQGEKQAVARHQGRPSFGVGLNYTVVAAREGMDPPDNGKDVLMPMLRVKLPLYRQKYRGAVKEARYQEERFQQLRLDRKDELATRVDEAYRDHADALRRMELYRKQMSDARKARDILLDAFRTGDADVDELLELQRKLYKYRSALERARADRNKAVARFKKMLAR